MKKVVVPDVLDLFFKELLKDIDKEAKKKKKKGKT